MGKRGVRIDAHDIVGRRFGMLVVDSLVGSRYDSTAGGDRKRYWYNVVCDCGNTKTMQRGNIVARSTGRVKGCGCLRRRSAVLECGRQK